jgi:hypothetical protein
MASKLGVVVVVIAFDGRIFDRAVITPSEGCCTSRWNSGMGSDHCKLVKILFQLNETKRYSIGNIFLCLQLRLCTCHDIYQDGVIRRLDH